MESRRAAIIESAKTIEIDELKREQYLAIDSILRGKDTFVSLPTGYGKSVAKYTSRGLTSELVVEAQTVEAMIRVFQGEVQLDFITPESIIKQGKY